jgi:hypothetical protein
MINYATDIVPLMHCCIHSTTLPKHVKGSTHSKKILKQAPGTLPRKAIHVLTMRLHEKAKRPLNSPEFTTW